MKRRILTLLALIAALALLAGCGSIAPKEKTIVLSEQAAQPDQSGSDAVRQSFEVKKIARLSLEKLDPDGIHPDLSRGVIGWIDNDNLAAMSVQYNAVEQESDAEVEQTEQRVFTQFVRINYQYGFYDPILTLADVEAECFDLSADGRLAAYVAGNELSVYDLGSGQSVLTTMRQVLASRVTFAQQGNEMYFTDAGDEKKLERVNPLTGATSVVRDGKSYRVLAADGDVQLICTQSGGEEQISFRADDVFCEDLLTGGKSGSACVLPSGQALFCYRADLYLADQSGAQCAAESVTAFDIASDGMHIAYALENEDGTVDIRVGYWGGSRIINDKLTYKDIGMNVRAMYFSPDMRKLYLQGTNPDTGALQAYSFEFQ